MRHRWLVAGLSILAMAACSGTGGLRTSGKGAFAPPGVDARRDDVDGLLVGHRLMASGEYELALRSYYRAGSERGLTVDVLSAVGSANLKLGRLLQAEKVLRRAIEADETFVPAWNNLGVVLMEKGEYGEAERVFRTAFALDSGQSAAIKENLSLALAKLKDPGYDIANITTFALMRRGTGDYRLLTTQ